MSIKKSFFKSNCINSLKNLVMASVILVATPSSCYPMEFMLNSSFGLDFGNRCMRFHDLYGRDHFAKKHYHYLSPYLHTQLLRHLGIQVGFERTENRKMLKQYSQEEIVLGNIGYTIGADTNVLSASKVKGTFIGLNLNSDILFKQYALPIQLSVFAGISITKIYLSFVDLTLVNLTDQPLSQYTKIMNSGRKVIPKASLNLKYILPQNNKISLKLGYGWTKTSPITIYKMDVETGQSFLIKLKNSHLFTIGFICSI